MPTLNQQRLDLYLAAEAKILSGQSVRFGDRQLTRADLEAVQKEIARLQTVVDRDARVANGGGRFSQADFGGRI
ncbi:primosomal replication protein PriB/PriC domain protein [Marilutibacter spongiae]|uniref:primosomal replication protein PriB/PriC domain protein n=1 Tax=Marilutibacter spongiae TaxID=2025720 RepID=UPI0031B5F1B0